MYEIDDGEIKPSFVPHNLTLQLTILRALIRCGYNTELDEIECPY